MEPKTQSDNRKETDLIGLERASLTGTMAFEVTVLSIRNLLEMTLVNGSSMSGEIVQL